jgi:MSHA biogenesis protein MshK
VAPSLAKSAAPAVKTNDVPFVPSSSDPTVASLKVQGIFYRLTKASALINGQTLFVGDEIDGAKLVAIERHCVRMLVEGRTNVLRLH